MVASLSFRIKEPTGSVELVFSSSAAAPVVVSALSREDSIFVLFVLLLLSFGLGLLFGDYSYEIHMLMDLLHIPFIALTIYRAVAAGRRRLIQRECAEEEKKTENDEEANGQREQWEDSI